MTRFMTTEEYGAIAKGPSLPAQSLIDGAFRPATAFGDCRSSGFGGRDKSLHAHDRYTEPKTIWADISDPESAQTLH